tara:strand:+ start:8406 stop:9062 length:657 start_codon:yes stop_codon:yes gene_type:complete
MSSSTQNELLLTKLLLFYNKDDNIDKMLTVINGKSKISLRIVDWFATNYSKKHYIVYPIEKNNKIERFKVYNDYKLSLKAYSKKRFDPFCRWERTAIPYKNGTYIQTTIGQLNFFKWALENNVLTYIEENYYAIDNDMNLRNSTTKYKNSSINSTTSNISNTSNTSIASNSSIESNSTSNSIMTNNKNFNKTRKKREELSCNASKGVKKETVETIISF